MEGSDLRGPIPPGTIRVSVRYGSWLYVCDLTTAQIWSALDLFEEMAGATIRLGHARGTWRGVEGASSIASRAVKEDAIELLAVAVVWMYLNRPGMEEECRRKLLRLIEHDGGAWIVGVTDEHGIEWSLSVSPVELSRYGKAGDPPVLPDHGITVH